MPDPDHLARPDAPHAPHDKPDSTLESSPVSPYSAATHAATPDSSAQTSDEEEDVGADASAAQGRDAHEGSSMEHDPDEAPQLRVRSVVDPHTVRRAPRYGRFGFVGLVLGLVVAIIVYQFPIDPMTNARALLVILLILLGGAGLGAGYAVALMLDRRSLRRHTRR